MEAFKKLADGRHVCPVCNKAYLPKLGPRKWPGTLIQHEFPYASADDREQHVSGICSPECWDKAVQGMCEV